MPSKSVLEAKQAVVAELAERLKNSVMGVVVSYKGINVEDDTKLRKELRENNVKYTVVKNTLLKRANEEVGLSEMDSVLKGTTALATSDEDYAAAARILANFAKDHDFFEIKSGFMDGEIVDLETINSLAKLPTREVLLANVLGAFQAPISAFARVIQAIVDEGGVENCKPAEKEEAAEETAEAPAEEAKAEEAPAEEAKAEEAPAEEAKTEEAPAEEAKTEEAE
ncbi:MAG: 50S ribosomal protein L10 [Ruminococcus sp.]|nr:50S ribosomal protein L10 [Ruminococcus sp.]